MLLHSNSFSQMNSGSIVHLETRESAKAEAQLDALLRIDIRLHRRVDMNLNLFQIKVIFSLAMNISMCF